MGMFGSSANNGGGFDWERAVLSFLGAGPQLQARDARRRAQLGAEQERDAEGRRQEALGGLIGANGQPIFNKNMISAMRGEDASRLALETYQPRQFASGGGSMRSVNPTTGAQTYEMAPSERELGRSIIRTSPEGVPTTVFEGIEPVPVQQGGAVYGWNNRGPVNGAAPPSRPATGGPPSTAPRVGQARPAAPTVPDAAAVVRQLFPQARVTDGRRDPNSPLGRRNPNSYHNRTGGAADVAPIPGMTFEQYVQRYRDAGYQIIEARDEQRSPLPHTTGPNWHVVLGQRTAGGPRPSVTAGAPRLPVQVRTADEARRLPRRTIFTTPDGRRKIR